MDRLPCVRRPGRATTAARRNGRRRPLLPRPAAHAQGQVGLSLGRRRGCRISRRSYCSEDDWGQLDHARGVVPVGGASFEDMYDAPYCLIRARETLLMRRRFNTGYRAHAGARCWRERLLRQVPVLACRAASLSISVCTACAAWPANTFCWVAAAA